MSDKKKVYLRSFGCQMNERDSENIIALLARNDFEQTPDPKEADLLLVNTCSIREHASHKADSQLGRLGKIKFTSNRNPILGVAGCLAQQEKEKFLKRFPFVDLILGPDVIHRLPQLIERIQKHSTREIDVNREVEKPIFLHEYLPYPVSQPQEKGRIANKAFAYVVISRGCDFRCTFCVVPNTRGPEVSVPPDEIINEVKMFIEKGVREIILLGQNVNSYGKNFNYPFPFSKLLQLIEEKIPLSSSLKRIRFTTSHPIDCGEDLMKCFRELPRLCPHLHLPVQTGSDRILRRMKRLYSISDYKKRLQKVQSYCQNISLSTDIIVGFPGETQAEFEQTLDLLREIRYTHLYAFKYSPRPNTPALRLPDEVPEEMKDRRLKELLALQEEISFKNNKGLVGEEMEVLVEGSNPKSPWYRFSGRSICNRKVHFSAQTHEDLRSKLVKVTIEKAQTNSLLGKYQSGSAR